MGLSTQNARQSYHETRGVSNFRYSFDPCQVPIVAKNRGSDEVRVFTTRAPNWGINAPSPFQEPKFLERFGTDIAVRVRCWWLPIDAGDRKESEMTHRFDRSQSDPYAESAKQVEERVYSSGSGVASGAEEQIFDIMSNAIVDSLGDIAAQAFRHGLNNQDQMRGLADAVSRVSELVLTSYRGEVDPEGALEAITSDPRFAALTPEAKANINKEIEKTREFEKLLLNSRRMRDLLDYIGSTGLRMPDDITERGTVLLAEHPTPTAGSAESQTG
jgi:hypothetical protein